MPARTKLTSPKKWTAPKNLSVLVFFEDGYWIAHCIEYDIVAEAKRFDDIKAALAHSLASHIIAKLANNEHPFATTPKAPAKYKKQFDAIKDTFDSDSAKPVLQTIRKSIRKRVPIPSDLRIRPAINTLPLPLPA